MEIRVEPQLIGLRLQPLPRLVINFDVRAHEPGSTAEGAPDWGTTYAR